MTQQVIGLARKSTPTPLKSKFRNKKTQDDHLILTTFRIFFPLSAKTAVFAVVTLLVLLATFSTFHWLFPRQLQLNYPVLSQTLQDQGSPFSDDPNSDDVECVNISQQPDPCKFIHETDSCEVDGLIPWLEFRYCTLGPRISSHFVPTLIAVSLMALVLIVVMASLGDTSDTFFVSALTHVASELKLSPAVAGITFVAFGNASPDTLTAVASINSGEVLLVLGALAGACVCISFFVLGASVFAAPPGHTTLPKPSFLRSMTGYTICIGTFVGLAVKGHFHLYDAIILMSVYGVYLLLNVIYLQRQEYQHRLHQKHKRRETFLKSSSAYKNFDPETQLLLSSTDDAELPQHVNKEIKERLKNHNSYLPPQIDSNGALRINQSDQIHTGTLSDIDTSSYISDISEQSLIDDQCALTDAITSSPDQPGTADLSGVASAGDPEGLDGLSDPNEDSDADDEIDADLTYYMHGVSWPNPEWAEEQNKFKFGFSLALWILMFPLSLLRWLSIPSTDIRPDKLRSFKRVMLFTSPLFLSVFLLFNNTDGFKYDKEDQLLWILFPTIGSALSLLLATFYFLIVVPAIAKYDATRARVRSEILQLMSRPDISHEVLHELSIKYLEYDLDIEDESEAKPGVLSLFQLIMSLLAFVGSVAWLSTFADEIVNLLASIGLMFGISSTILGLTVLALGNSLPDLISNSALAKRGKITVSYAAIFGAPVLSSTAGLSIALFAKFFQHFGTDQAVINISFKLSGQLILTFAFTGAGILAHSVVFPWFNYTPSRKYGIVMIIGYVVFLASAVLMEILK